MPAPLETPRPVRHPALTAAAALGLSVLTGLVMLAFLGKFPPAPRDATRAGAVFYVLAYHYGYAFYDRTFAEVGAMEVKAGEPVTLHILPAQALPRELVLAYAERSLRAPIGGLAAGDPQIRQKILEDFALGNVEHIIGITGLPVHVTTNVTAALNARPFREGGPATLREAVERGDPIIKTVTFTAKRVGAYDVLCVDSGMDGAGTCGWGHKWMVAKGAFIVRPP